jgi:hypothetical protein
MMRQTFEVGEGDIVEVHTYIFTPDDVTVRIAGFGIVVNSLPMLEWLSSPTYKIYYYSLEREHWSRSDYPEHQLRKVT